MNRFELRMAKFGRCVAWECRGHLANLRAARWPCL